MGFQIELEDYILLISENDLSNDVMEWEDTIKACLQLGEDWRLPTKKELLAMYEELHLKGIGNFNDFYNYYGLELDGEVGWFFDFDSGEANELYGKLKDASPLLARAVKTDKK